MASPFQAIFSSSLSGMLPVELSSQKLSITMDIYLETELGTEDSSAHVSGYSFDDVRVRAPLPLWIWA